MISFRRSVLLQNLLRGVWVLMLAGVSQTGSAQTTPDAIRDRLKDQPLYLRGQWLENKLKFNTDGSPEKVYKRLPFSECGIDVYAVKQKGDVLQIEGQRMGLSFDPKGAMSRVKLEGKDYDGHITIEIAGSAGTDYTAAVDGIFAELGDLMPQMPDFWQLRKGAFQADYKGIFRTSAIDTPAATGQTGASQPSGAGSASPPPAAAQASDAASKPNHVSAGVKAPKLLQTVDPQFSQAARMLKKSGNVEIYLWIGADGTPSHIRIARPVGLGLDEQAVDAAAHYKFAPATKDGVPVKVDIYMDVNFQIF